MNWIKRFKDWRNRKRQWHNPEYKRYYKNYNRVVWVLMPVGAVCGMVGGSLLPRDAAMAIGVVWILAIGYFMGATDTILKADKLAEK